MTQPPAVMNELTQHELSMNGMMAHMDHAMRAMMGCSQPELGRMSARSSDLRTAMTDHRTRLDPVTTVEAAHGECGAHQVAVDVMIDGMSADVGQMSCMMMNH
jgi:hypothetical protein